MSSGQLLIPIEYLEVPLPATCFLVRPPFRNKSDPLKVAVDAIGPETDFTLETDGKMCTKNK